MRLFRRIFGEPLRKGLIEMTLKGPRDEVWNAQAEVVELERRGGMSRVMVRRMSGVPGIWSRSAVDLVPGWVPTNSVRWFD